MIPIHPLQAEDISGCAHIMSENPLWQRYGVTPQSALLRISTGFEQTASILVAGPVGNPLGFIWYVQKGAFARSGYVMLIGVDPNQQGKGTGDALMDAAEANMFQHTSDIFLLVSDFNTSAQRFYQRRGYTQTGSLPAYVLPDITELLYRKTKPTH